MTCIGNDPFCPCQDGLLCHYKDSPDGKTKTMQTHYDGCWRDPKHHACAVAKIEALEVECLEQARLNGMGAEREAALRARVDELEAVAKNLIAQKGRHNTEIAYKRLVAALQNKQP